MSERLNYNDRTAFLCDHGNADGFSPVREYIRAYRSGAFTFPLALDPQNPNVKV